jgi:serine/threonine-protein kinase RsbW
MPASTGSPDGHRLVVANKFSELERACEWVRGLAHERALSHRLAHGLELAVNEALTNIISYAYRDDAPHDIVVSLHAHADRITVEVEDDGTAFNPLEVPAEKPPASLDEARPTGRGIVLMRGFMDELRYLRRDGWNVLTMVLYCAKA